MTEQMQQWIDKLWSEEGKAALDWLRERGLQDKSIADYHLGFTGSEGYANSVAIPYFSVARGLRTVRFRKLEGLPKYTQPPHERRHLFNVSSVKHPQVFITEGEFDCILLEQLGIHSVGVPGVNGFDPDWKFLFTGNRVFIIYDADEPGLKNARKLYRVLEPYAERVEVVELPEDEDVTSLYLKDQKALLECVNSYLS